MDRTIKMTFLGFHNERVKERDKKSVRGQGGVCSIVQLFEHPPSPPSLTNEKVHSKFLSQTHMSMHPKYLYHKNVEIIKSSKRDSNPQLSAF